MRILVTGGAGFIGSALVLYLVRECGHELLNADCLSYATNPLSLKDLVSDERYRLVQADICDDGPMREVVADFEPDAIVHLAAETHVDRSIDDPAVFVRTNVFGTFSVLEAARAFWNRLDAQRQSAFRFLHVSTDEVFGSLGTSGQFDETSRYDPRSPYAASKAASDHLVRAWGQTYGVPMIISNCSNNYGPRQFPEKLIPLTIINALEGAPIRIYGDGGNVRDWLHVEDHARALAALLKAGQTGESYGIGGRAERTNLAVARAVCAILDRVRPDGAPHDRLITLVTDRPGHDRRYAMSCVKIEQQVGWRARFAFEDGLEQTVRWYLDNEDWWRPLRAGRYAGERLGLGVR